MTEILKPFFFSSLPPMHQRCNPSTPTPPYPPIHPVKKFLWGCGLCQVEWICLAFSHNASLFTHHSSLSISQCSFSPLVPSITTLTFQPSPFFNSSHKFIYQASYIKKCRLTQTLCFPLFPSDPFLCFPVSFLPGILTFTFQDYSQLHHQSTPLQIIK